MTSPADSFSVNTGLAAVKSYSRWSHWPRSPFLPAMLSLIHSTSTTLTFLLILKHMTPRPALEPLVSLCLLSGTSFSQIFLWLNLPVYSGFD